MIRSRIYSTFLIIIFFQAFLLAQVLDLVHYPAQNGIQLRHVNNFYQDKFGRLWVTNGDGLSIFNGNEFIHYTTSDGLPIDVLTSIIPSKRDYPAILIGTHGAGLTRHNDGIFSTIKIDTIESSNYISALMEDTNENLWIGTMAGVYHQTKSGKIERYKISNDNEEIIKILEIPEGILFISFRSIILLKNDNSELLFDLKLSARELITDLLIDAKGSVWISTSVGHLFKSSEPGIYTRVKITNGIIHEIIEDRNGFLWAATDEGLLRIDKDVMSKIKQRDFKGIINFWTDYVHSIYIDLEENIWIGIYGKGLYMVEEPSLSRFTIIPVKPGYFYTPAADLNNRIWFVEGDGIKEVWQSGSAWQHTKHKINEGQIITLRTTTDNSLWIGFSDGKIRKYKITGGKNNSSSKLKIIKTLYPGKELPAEKWMFFNIYDDGTILLSCNSFGIVILDGETYTPKVRLTEEEGLPSRHISVVKIDNQKNFWFGGIKGGIAIFRQQGDSLVFYKQIKEDDVKKDLIRSIFIDKKDRAWIGSRHGGLIIYENEISKIINKEDGLLSNVVWDIAEDISGYIWIAANGGVQCIDPVTFKILKTIKDPESRSVFSCGVANEILWGWSDESFFVFNLKDFHLQRTPLSTFIRDITVNGSPRSLSENIKLSFNENNISFDFASVSFRDRNNIRYQYRLIGAVENWSPLTYLQRVSYASLRPGNYIFEVQAVNNSYTIQNNSASFSFSVNRPWWLTWWFRISFLVFVGAVLYGLHLLRVKKLLEVERTRLGIARDLHDEVGSTLSSISYFSKALENEADAKGIALPHRFLNLITESSASAKASISDIIWAIDPSNDSWENLSSKLHRYASDALESNSINYNIDITGSLQKYSLTMDQRRHLWLVFKEIVNNAIKHSMCSNMQISLLLAGRTLELIIKDNGKGFDSSKISEGNGLNNIKGRVKLIKGKFELNTSPGNGTQWRVTFQL